MSDKEKRMHRCCFTGHRPEKLQATETEVVAMLRDAIKQAIDDGFRTFITGMARGVDIWAAEVVLAFRETYPDVHLICALPHPDFEKRWSRAWQERYTTILQRADLVKIIWPEFSMASYQIRNEWMVDHSARVIAVYNDEPGGTRNTIQYAEIQGVNVRLLRLQH